MVIPVYNVENYIEKCLRSCADQDIPYSDYEIIVINDGTKDLSLSIAERVAKEYPNISILSQENRGLGAARNRGLTLARGEYIWFIDSDDWIECKCLSKIVDFLFLNSLDCLMICAADNMDGKFEERINHGLQSDKVYSGIDLLKMRSLTPCATLSIFRKTLLESNNLKFMEGIFHEDSEFTPRALYFAGRVSGLSDIVYFTSPNPNSITRSNNPKKAFDCIQIAKSLHDFSKSIPEKIHFGFDNKISIIINNSFNYSYQMDKWTIRNLNTSWGLNKYLFSHLLKSPVIKYKLEGILFYIFPRHTIQIYKTIQLLNINRYK
jgi:glycosyltransferase involved in cell wall biosynthesis